MKCLNAASENMVDYSWGYEAVVHPSGTTNVCCDVFVISMFVSMYICQVSGRQYLRHHFGVLPDFLVEITHEYDVLIVVFCSLDKLE